MLIQFSVGNYKTFKETATLSMVASNYFKELPENTVVVKAGSGQLILLKSVAVYGANASGKSKLLDAMRFVNRFVRNSSKESQQGDPIKVDPFRLNQTTENAPSLFEVMFVQNGVQYRYGFSVDKQRVHTEWLYRKAFRVEVEVFTRSAQEFSIHGDLLKKGNLLIKEDLVRENALLLSVAAQFKDPLAEQVLAWFSHFQGISGTSDHGHMGFTLREIAADTKRKLMLSLLDSADVGISEIELKEEEILIDNLSPEFRDLVQKESENKEKSIMKVDIQAIRTLYSEENMPVGSVPFDFSEESAGTRKYFALLGPLLNSCEQNAVLFVDELDAKLHPNLVKKVISFFHQEKSNPHHSQLIFNTHNTNLLNSDLFRRDQIWFTEKDRYGAATLYSLAEFKGIGKTARKENNHEKQYLSGVYGATPYLGDFDILENLMHVEP